MMKQMYLTLKKLQRYLLLIIVADRMYFEILQTIPMHFAPDFLRNANFTFAIKH